MNHSFWLIVIFVATVVCNTNCRPQDDRAQIYFRAHEPPKDSDQANRYGKKTLYLDEKGEGAENSRGETKYRMKRDVDPVTFVRIDIPYNKTRIGILRSIGETNPTYNHIEKDRDREEEIQYVPVSISTKGDNTKKWPNGQTGIESPDDLYLYNTYTSAINDKIKPSGSPNQVVPYISNKKPAIIIIEELTTRRPYFENPAYPTNTHTYTPVEMITYRPEPTKPSFFGTSFPSYSTTERPNIYSSVVYPPVEVTYPSVPSYATTARPLYPSVYPLETTKPPKAPKPSCPTVTITATNTIINNKKEGCNDIKINIESSVYAKPKPPVAAAADVPVHIGGSHPITVTPVVSVTPKPEEEMTSFFGLGGVNRCSVKKWLPFRRQLKRAATLQPTDKAVPVTKAVPDIESIAVVARATSDGPAPLPVEYSPDVPGQMVESDIRTPPKLKEIILGKISNDGKRKDELESLTESEMVVDRIEANGKFELPNESERANSFPYAVSEGKANNPKKKDEDMGIKGIAVPVLMDDMDSLTTSPPKKLQKIAEVVKPVKDEKKKTNSKPVSNPTTTPSSGLSTWILLSDNKDSTTVSPKKNNKKETSNKTDDRKTVTTTKKPGKIQPTTLKPDTTKTALVTKKGIVTTKPEIRKSDTESATMSALEAMVKNQKKTTLKSEDMNTTKLPVQKKQTTTKPNRINDRMDVAETKDKQETNLTENKKPSTIPPMLPIATQNPTTVGLLEQQGTSSTTTDPSVETTTKKKKIGTKKKKKNKNRRRKPSSGSDTQPEQKNAVKNTKSNPKQPVGAQLYNFLSREIMPTVGLGLVGVLVTAGLAGLLGYNPFVGANLPVRRTYEIQHGYSPNGYYSYNTDYSDGGQSEEALFREVLSGIPEGSKYGLAASENSYPESQIYNSQDQVYDAMKEQPDKKYKNSESGQFQYPDGKNDEEASNFDGTYSQEYSNPYAVAYDSPEILKTRDNSDKYPMYDREVSASYVYPEGSSPEKSSRLNEEYDNGGKYMSSSVRYGADKISSKYSNNKGDTIERQPEALYRVAGDYDSYRSESTVQGVSGQSNWHRMGSAMDYRRFSHLEPGPRSLNFTKEEILTGGGAKKRTKRSSESVIQRIARKQSSGTTEKDIENEIDFEDSVSDIKDNHYTESTTERSETTTLAQNEDSLSTTTEADYEIIETNPIAYNFLDVLKRLAQYKLRMGLSFLKSTTDAFSRYLDVIQKRVDESMTNTTIMYRIRRNPNRSKRSVEMKKFYKKQDQNKRKIQRKYSLKKN